MKLFKVILFFQMMVATTFVHAQSTDISGKWQLDWSKMYNAMSQAEQNKFNGLPEQTRTRVTASFSSRIYDFQPGGSLEISWQSNSGTKTNAGTWSVSGTNLIMVINSTEKTYGFSRTADTLTLTMQEVGAEALVSNLVMNKL